jgi:hypothetical protein
MLGPARARPIACSSCLPANAQTLPPSTVTSPFASLARLAASITSWPASNLRFGATHKSPSPNTARPLRTQLRERHLSSPLASPQNRFRPPRKAILSHPCVNFRVPNNQTCTCFKTSVVPCKLPEAILRELQLLRTQAPTTNATQGTEPTTVPPMSATTAPARHRTCRMYWCYQCGRALRIISYPSTDVFCPRCFGRFLHEIDPPARPAFPPPHFLPHPFHPQHQYDGHPRRWVIYGGEPTTTVPGRAFRQPAPAQAPAIPPAPAPAAPVRRRVPSPPPPVPRRPSTPPAIDPGNYFTGPNLNNLIEELTQNDRPQWIEQDGARQVHSNGCVRTRPRAGHSGAN